ncbi:MAG: hypothetical protein IT379_18765 [Deltaproteobacteria bacterium]|nr:hypothetical protein [Deltaproteobacteria bacterium]
MSESRDDKAALHRLGDALRQQAGASGVITLDERGMRAMEELVSDLTGEKGIPMLKLHRDAPTRFRLQRTGRNAEVTVEWQRDIGAIVVLGDYLGQRKFQRLFVYDPNEARWRRMDGVRGLYEELTDALTEVLFPEVRR